ncbi:MAG: hypothetical protein PHR30_15140 [Gallionellaceae bacterium]|nr:hypothetical protein [Gallionellaceae bacterium]
MNLNVLPEIIEKLTFGDIAFGAIAFIGTIFVAVEGYKLNLSLLKHAAREVVGDLQEKNFLDRPHNGHSR